MKTSSALAGEQSKPTAADTRAAAAVRDTSMIGTLPVQMGPSNLFQVEGERGVPKILFERLKKINSEEREYLIGTRELHTVCQYDLARPQLPAEQEKLTTRRRRVIKGFSAPARIRSLT
jgi:hypothetical protein